MTENIHFTIDGSYQYKAYHNGICFQKSWHQLKFENAFELLAVKDDDVILDAACGSGVLTGLLAERTKAQVTAVDFNEAAIRFCKSTYPNSNVSFSSLNLEQRCFDGNSFSKIVMLEVLEHLTPDVASVILTNVYYYLRPGGEFVLSTPNKKSLWPAIEFMLDSFRLTPKMKGEQHVKLYDHKSLKQVLQGAGFKVKKVQTTHFVAPWLSFLGLGFSKKVHKLEQKVSFLPGSLLFVVATK